MTFDFQVYYDQLTLLLFCNCINNLLHIIYNSENVPIQFLYLKIGFKA